MAPRAPPAASLSSISDPATRSRSGARRRPAATPPRARVPRRSDGKLPIAVAPPRFPRGWRDDRRRASRASAVPPPPLDDRGHALTAAQRHEARLNSVCLPYRRARVAVSVLAVNQRRSGGTTCSRHERQPHLVEVRGDRGGHSAPAAGGPHHSAPRGYRRRSTRAVPGPVAAAANGIRFVMRPGVYSGEALSTPLAKWFGSNHMGYRRPFSTGRTLSPRPILRHFSWAPG
jgi:hypothetical protein